MAEFSPDLKHDIALFRHRVFASPFSVLDPPNVHHEFVSGIHAQKLDFDKIETDSDLYIQWVSIYSRAIIAIYKDALPDALVGVANGANRLATSIAPLLGEAILDLTTTKSSLGIVTLDEQSLETVQEMRFGSALVIDDVGTTGSSMIDTIEQLRESGVKRVEAMYGWQRSAKLPRLDAIDCTYDAVILSPLPNFSPQECQELPEGYCYRDVQFIPYDRS